LLKKSASSLSRWCDARGAQATRIHEDIFGRNIDVQVLRLREKLEVDPSPPRVIRTERGAGYAFALPVEPF
jgi:DNA-binding response OmpR family regulator